MERKSNHSLRATGATEMFAANVPEKLMQSRTGHCSLDALRLYERPSHEQQQAVSKILTSAEPQRPRRFGEELTNVQSSASSSSGGMSLQMVNNHSTRSTIQSRPPSLQLPALLGSMNHCSVNINVNFNAQQPSRSVEEEFDHLVTNVNFPF